MSDRTLTCRDCGQTFTFTAGEQAFYQERGFSEPTRCKACRDKRKAERNASGGGGGYDSYGGSSYGGSSYSNGGGYGSSGRDYNSAPRQMYPAICSSCGKETEVPFEPRSDKPVFCRECFQERRASTPRYGSSY
jgi:CxxC-x17-CxxC domain-containing protein